MKKRNLEDKILALLQVEHLLSAAAIVERLAELHQSYNKTSVYRALERLLQKGQLCQQHLGENGISYELRSAHHEHLQCENCGAVEAVECSFIHPPSLNGFRISHHHLTYLGICQDCQ